MAEPRNTTNQNPENGLVDEEKDGQDLDPILEAHTLLDDEEEYGCDDEHDQEEKAGSRFDSFLLEAVATDPRLPAGTTVRLYLVKTRDVPPVYRLSLPGDETGDLPHDAIEARALGILMARAAFAATFLEAPIPDDVEILLSAVSVPETSEHDRLALLEALKTELAGELGPKRAERLLRL